ncbi:MAG: DNA repair exonuclease [Pseudomonadota bacterium]
MNPFRFVHAGDLHLDSPQRTLADLNDPRADVLREASRRAFTEVVAEAIRRDVDAVLIAGDLWDGDWRDVSAGLFVQDKLAELADHRIAAVAILGNHDAESAVTSRVREVPHLHLLPSNAPASVDLGGAVVHGQSFAQPAVLENLAQNYPDAWPGRINIGLLYTALEGDARHAPYAPCSLADLAARGYHYWALGHVHQRQIVREGTPADGGTVAYCGVLQGRDIGETGVKGAWYGEATLGGVSLTPIDLPFVVWERLRVDMAGSADPLATIGAAVDELRGKLDQAVGLCVVRVELVGESALHDGLPLRAQELRERAEEAMGSAGRLMLERVKIATRPVPGGDAPKLPAGFDADLMAAAQDDAVRNAARTAVAEVLGELNAEAKAALKAAYPDLAQLVDGGELRPLLDDAAHRLARRIVDER